MSKMSKNAQDSTVRNDRASLKRDLALKARLIRLELRVKQLTKLVAKLG